MEKLSRSASGLRHLRWAREVLASLEAHYEHNGRLRQAEREAVLEEAVDLRASVQALSSAVKAYRDFLERRRVSFRGMQRVGLFLCADALDKAESSLLPLGAEGALSGERTQRSLGSPDKPEDVVERTRDGAKVMKKLSQSVSSLAEHVDSLNEVAAILEGFNESYAHMEERERAPLKSSLSMAVDALRNALESMDSRLEKLVSRAFVESLYPPLARERTMVADQEDQDDDATAKS